MTERCPTLRELLALVDRVPGGDAAHGVSGAPSQPPPIPTDAGASNPPLPDDTWAHVRSCPRCRSLLAAYHEFESPQVRDRCEGEPEAVARLGAFLESMIVGPGAAPTVAAIPGARRLAGGRAGEATRVGEIFRLLTGSGRLVPVAGAAAIVAAVFLLVRGNVDTALRSTVLREQPAESAVGSIVVFPPRPVAGRGLELRWRRGGPDDTYRVRLLDSGMREVGCVEAGRETLLVLATSALTGPRLPVFWQVEALREGDRVGDSPPGELPLLRGR